jgi:N-methylhydantoinase A
LKDVLVIGRQTRRELYNIFVTRPEPLVADELRFGVRERTLYDGSIQLPLDEAHLQHLLEQLRIQKVESIAVSLLYSFANPAHENAILSALDALAVPVSLSSRILPDIGSTSERRRR